MAKSKKQEELERQIDVLTEDVQRTRADFENYRKRTEADKAVSYRHGEAAAIMKLLPIIDNIERAIVYAPAELAENKWAQGVTGLVKNLEKQLESLNVRRVVATPGTAFNPEVHEAIQIDEESQGDKEVIAEELQAGYMLGDAPIRPAMVKVTRQ